MHGAAEAGGGGSDKGVGAVVEVEHEGVGAFDKGVGRVLVRPEEGELVDDVGLDNLTVFLLVV